MDVPTIHQGYVDGCDPMDICSDNSHRGRGGHVEHHVMKQLFDLLEWAGYLLAGVVVTALILIVLGMLL